mgnify:CR=1 FL=1
MSRFMACGLQAILSTVLTMKKAVIIFGCVMVAACLFEVVAWQAVPLNAVVMVNSLVGFVLVGFAMILAGGGRVMVARFDNQGALGGGPLKLLTRGWMLAGYLCLAMGMVLMGVNFLTADLKPEE